MNIRINEINELIVKIKIDLKFRKIQFSLSYKYFKKVFLFRKFGYIQFSYQN